MTPAAGTDADLRTLIRELEEESLPLEPDRNERAHLRAPLFEYAEGFLDRIRELPAYGARKEAAEELRELPFTDGGRSMRHLVDVFRRSVQAPGLNPASGGHLGYIPGGGVYTSALGDFLADITNEYAGIRFGGPGAVEMENACIRWMADLMGYPDDVAGNLASGGSIANLIAVVTAREAHGLRAADYSRAVVYTTDHLHHCVDKAVRVAGLGECRLRRVSMDDRWRMDPAELDGAILEDTKEGLRPWMVVASAGTTDVGAIDPLDEIADVAEDHGVWYHVDAAYGGFFALCPELRPRLRGIERSDSVVVDPHKGLFLPYGLGAVLIKDRDAMHRAHRYQAAYMQDAEGETVDSPAELSPELTKHFRGLRMWLPLQLHGLEPFRSCLMEKHLLARYFREEAAEAGFETGPEPELSVVTYRWIPREGDPDAFNAALLREIHEDGRVFVSSTRLGGRFVLRLAALSFRTHLREVDLLLDLLREKVEELESRPEMWRDVDAGPGRTIETAGDCSPPRR